MLLLAQKGRARLFTLDFPELLGFATLRLLWWLGLNPLRENALPKDDLTIARLISAACPWDYELATFLMYRLSHICQTLR